MTGHAWPPMPRLVDEVPRLADQLPRVHRPEDARDALRAADGIHVFDGPATAWLLLGRGLFVMWCAVLLLATTRNEAVDVPLLCGLVVGFVVVVVTGGPLERRAGAEPRAWPVWLARSSGAEPRAWPVWRYIAVTTFSWAVFLIVALTEPADPEALDPLLAGAAAVVGLAYLLAPVVRWAWARGRPHDAIPWPPGSEGFAVLSVLARARRVHPDRLAALTGLQPVRCGEWVTACAVRGLVVTGTSRWFFPRGTAITATGRTRLEEWTVELTDLAAGAQPWTSSTAPTSPAVSSPRSASDVT